MARRRIKGVLDNFLGTYISRYSDFDGYWLFGILFSELETLSIDLIAKDNLSRSTPVAKARQLAGVRFQEQIDKAGLSISAIREAHLEIIKLSDSRTGPVNGRICAGSTMRFVAKVVFDSGKQYERERSIFVAPHDSKIEFRSAI